jgi:hypothetical protein
MCGLGRKDRRHADAGSQAGGKPDGERRAGKGGSGTVGKRGVERWGYLAVVEPGGHVGRHLQVGIVPVRREPAQPGLEEPAQRRQPRGGAGRGPGHLAHRGVEVCHAAQRRREGPRRRRRRRHGGPGVRVLGERGEGLEVARQVPRDLGPQRPRAHLLRAAPQTLPPLIPQRRRCVAAAAYWEPAAARGPDACEPLRCFGKSNGPGGPCESRGRAGAARRGSTERPGHTAAQSTCAW